AQIRLVTAILQHGFAVRNTRERACWRYRLAARKLFKHACKHRFDRLEDVFLRYKAHFKVELVEFRAAVSAQVFVAEARCNLEVTVKARHHQQLLEHLRRLRKRVETAWVQTRWHQIVARAFRARRAQDWRLKLGEALGNHAVADRGDDLAAQHDVAVQAFTAKIDEAILQANVFWILLLTCNRERQFVSAALHGHFACKNFNLAGWQIRVCGARSAILYHTINRHNAFNAQ